MQSQLAYYTLEMRWFFDLPSPAIESWFRSRDSFMDNNERKDHYLLVHPHTNFSYKLREGKTEFKLLLEEYGMQEFENGMMGKLQRWAKWSLPLKDKQHDPLNLYALGADNFITISKKRELVIYEVAGNAISKVEAGGLPANGCQFEYTHLSIGNKSWYSFGVEAFGDRAQQEKNFGIACDKLFFDFIEPMLNSHNSFSYPSFISSPGQNLL